MDRFDVLDAVLARFIGKTGWEPKPKALITSQANPYQVPPTMSDFRFKQVIVMRSDLKMGKGKIAAQAGHAAVSAAEEARRQQPKWWKNWLDEGQCKIAVKVKSEEELLEIEDIAGRVGLPHALITDRGLTQIEPGTVTCLAIGPAPSFEVDKITGKLALF
jgi:PTH2 family peptidyl-tRNA hydrolase